MMRRLALLIVVLLPACTRAQTAPSPAFGRADTARLHHTLDSLAAAHHGVVGYAVHNLDTGERMALRGDSTFPTASLIKVSVLVTLFELIEKDSISLDDRIIVLKIDKVPGSGLLQNLHDGMEITVRDAAFLMSTISDNTATNLLLDKVPIRRTWKKVQSLGLMHTKIHATSLRRDHASAARDSPPNDGPRV